MSNVYSTAVLGLKVDTREFNASIKDVSKTTLSSLETMRLSAANFEGKWDNLTAGVKDTKRIISGILVSRAFYSIMEGLNTASSAALNFSKNMETATISMSYFVEGADKAAKATAYLRTLNEFAARTPFSTEQALSMSQYIQSMGMSIGLTKSYLSVITDAAAATGATPENLQRITLALGQMMTKGRLASEEIRQLANANIPVYEILQEELKLTGKQISNIGKYWVDADTAVEAILTGLEKRYKGAADRIADTVTGMLDTIVDDSKIIAQQAGSNIYEGFKGNLTKVRDLLDKYRDIVTERGSVGLLAQVMNDIDPSGKFETWVLTTVGNVRQLGTALYDCYKAAAPLLNLLGRSFATSLNVATVVLTSFTKVTTDGARALEKLGITTGQLSSTLASLYIGYKASRWMLTLGEGAYYAAYNIYRAATSIASLLPAGMAAYTGLSSVTMGLAGAASAALLLYAVISKLSDFAGLTVSNGASVDFASKLEEYNKAMDEYNKKINKYQKLYEEPYTSLTEDSADAVSSIKEVEKTSKKAAKSVKNDWLATFDEVFAIPRDKADKTGKKDELPDLGELLTPVGFTFPDFNSSVELEMPKFDWADLFDDSLFSANEDMSDRLKALLPYLIASGVLSAAFGFAKGAGKKLLEKVGAQSFSKEAAAAIKRSASVLDDAAELSKQADAEIRTLKKLVEKIEENVGSIDKLTQQSTNLLGSNVLEADIRGIAQQNRLALSEYHKTRADYVLTSAAQGLPPIPELDVIAVATQQLNKIRAAEIVDEIKTLEDGMHTANITASETNQKMQEVAKLRKELKTLGITGDIETASYTLEQTIDKLNDTALDFRQGFKELITGGTTPVSTPSGIVHVYDTGLYKNLNLLMERLDELYDQVVMLTATGEEISDGIGTQTVMLLHSFDGFSGQFKSLLSEGADLLNQYNTLVKSRGALSYALEDPKSLNQQIEAIKCSINRVQGVISRVGTALTETSQERLDAAERLRRDTAERLRIEKQRKEYAEEIAEAKHKAVLEERRAQLRRKTASSPWANVDKQNAAYRDAKADAKLNPNKKLEALELSNEEIAKRTKEMRKALRDAATEVKEAKETISFAKKTTLSPDTAEYKTLQANAREQSRILIQKQNDIVDIVKDASDRYGIGLDELIKPHSFTKESKGIIREAVGNAVEPPLSRLQRIALKNTTETKMFMDAITSMIPESTLASSAEDIKAVITVNGEKLAGKELAAVASSGTKTYTLAKGVGRFGDSISELLTRGLVTLDDIKLITASRSVDLAYRAALGTVLEPLALALAAGNVPEDVAAFQKGGWAASSKMPLITQDDALIKLINLYGNKDLLISNDIKTKSGHIVDYLYSNSKELLGGIREISDEVLFKVSQENWAQFVAQIATTHPNISKVGLTTFDVDTDWSKIDVPAARRLTANWQRAYAQAIGSAKNPEAFGGKIFSIEHIKKYGEVALDSSFSIDEITTAYFNNIIKPLLIKVKREGDSVVESVDVTPLRFAVKQWVVDFSSNMYTELQSALPSYVSKYAALKSIAYKTTDPKTIINMLNDYVEVNDGITKSIFALKTVFDSAASTIDDSARIVYDAVEAIDSINNAIAGGPEINATALRKFRGRIKKAFKLVNLANTETENILNELSTMIDTAERIGGTEAPVNLTNFKPIAAPIRFLNMDESFKYVARDLRAAIDAGVLQINDTSKALVKRQLDIIGDTIIVPQNIGKLSKEIDKSLGRFIIDIETNTLKTGDILANDFFPDVLQVSLRDRQTGKIYDWLVNNGEENERVLKQYLSKLGDTAAGANRITVEQLDSSKRLEEILKEVKEIVGEEKLTGYNVIGFDKPIIEHYGGTYNWGEDIMEAFQDLMHEYTGVNIHGPQTKVYELISGLSSAGAHNAAVDVVYANTIADAIESAREQLVGPLAQIVSKAHEIAEASGGTKISWKILEQASEELNKPKKMLLELIRTLDILEAKALPEIIKNPAHVVGEFLDSLELLQSGTLPALPKIIDPEAVKEALSFSRLFNTAIQTAANALEVGNKELAEAMYKAAASTVSNAAKAGELLGELPTEVTRYLSGATTSAIKTLEDAKKFAEQAAATAEGISKAGKAATSRSIFDNIKQFFTRLFDASEIGVNLGSGIADNGETLSKMFLELSDAAQKLKDVQLNNSFTGNINKGFKDASKAYTQAAGDFFDELIGSAHRGLKQYAHISDAKNISDLRKLAKNLEKDTDYLAYTFDKNGSFKLLTNTLFASGRDVAEAIDGLSTHAINAVIDSDEKLATAFAELSVADKAGKSIDDLSYTAKKLHKALDEFRLYNEGERAASELSDLAKLFVEKSDEIGNTLVIQDMAGNISYAGAKAAKAIDDVAESLSHSFTSISKKLIAGIGQFSILDAVGVAVEGIIQHSAQKMKENTLQYYLSINESTATITEALATQGYKIGVDIGDNVYNGVLEAMGQEAINAVISSGIGTAASAAMKVIAGGTASGLSLGVGALIAGGLSVAGSALINNTGGKSDVNLYLDDYLDALRTGSVLTDKIKQNAADALGIAELTEEQINDLERAVRDYMNRQLLNTTKNNLWERDEVNRLVFGKSTHTNLIDAIANLDEAKGWAAKNSKKKWYQFPGFGSDKYEDTITADSSLTLRLAKFLDIFDDSEIRTHDTGKRNELEIVGKNQDKQLKILSDILGVEVEAIKLTNSGTGVVIKGTSTPLSYSDEDMEAVEELLDFMYEGGYTSGAAAQAVLKKIEESTTLQKGIIDKYGEVNVKALSVLDDYIDIYNAKYNTSYSKQELESTGMITGLFEHLVGTYTAYTATWLKQAEMQAGLSENRRVLTSLSGENKSTDTYIWDASLKGITKETIAELEKFGIALEEGSITIDTDFTGAIEQSYIKLTTIPENIKEHLKGWTVDTSAFISAGGFDFGSVALSAQDVEILASAGIQINGDGTVTFMKAMNEAVTGSQRDFKLTADSFSDDVLQALSNYSIGLNFDASTLDFDPNTIAQKMSGAMFKLPDTFGQFRSKQVKELLEGLGKEMDSGYFMITNKAILNGQQTMSEYIKAMGSSKFNPKIIKAFENIDKLIADKGRTTSENIMEWANSIVVPSPIRADQITSEMEEAFREIGISFEQYGNDFLMVINQTGEHLKDGINVVDAEKWFKLDEDLRKGLKGIGVTVTDVLGHDVTEAAEAAGNQVMVDLSATFENGLTDVVSLFLDSPDLLDKIPEDLRARFEEAGFITQEGFTMLQNVLGGEFVKTTDGWIATWDGLTMATNAALTDMGLVTRNGLLQVMEAADECQIGRQLDNSVVCYFEDLPEDIRQTLTGGDTSLEAKLRGSKVALRDASKEAFADMLSVIGGAEDEVQEAVEAISKAIEKAASDIARMESIEVKKRGLFGLGKNYDEPVVKKGAPGRWEIMYGRETYIVPGATSNDALAIFKRRMGFNATGGVVDGISLTGELGRELAITPSGKAYMLGKNGPEVADLPKGTQIFNNEDTEKVLKYVPSIAGSKIKQYANGSGTSVNMTNKKVNIGSAGVAVNTILDSLVDVWKKAADKSSTVNSAHDIVDNTQASWNAFKDSVVENLSSTYEASKDTWSSLCSANTLESMRVSDDSWKLLSMQINDTLTKINRDGITEWDGINSINKLDAMKPNMDAGINSWLMLLQTIITQLDETGKAGSVSWGKYVESNPLSALTFDAASWKILKDDAQKRMQVVIDALQEVLDKAQLKAKISLNGAMSIGGGAGTVGIEGAAGSTPSFISHFLAGTGYISSGFGMRRHPTSGTYSMHQGVDIAALMGSPIKAGITGIVRQGYNHGGYGNYVDVMSPDGSFVRMAHMSAFNKNFPTGSYVGASDIVGYVGSTGNSTGPHIHVEYHPGGGRAVDPRNYFFAAGGVSTDDYALTGELGRELAVLPNGKITMLGKAGPEFGKLPRGTRIINNRDTEKIMDYVPGISGTKVKQYASGTGDTVVNLTEDKDEASILIEAIDYATDKYESIEFRLISGHTALIVDQLRESNAWLNALNNNVTSAVDKIIEALEKINVAAGNGSSKVNTDKMTEEELKKYVASEIAASKIEYNEANKTGDEEAKAQAHRRANKARELLGYTSDTGVDSDEITDLVRRNQSMIEYVAQEIAASKDSWDKTTSDEEKIAARKRANAARGLMGYSGGDDGTGYGDAPEDVVEAVNKLVEAIRRGDVQFTGVKYDTGYAANDDAESPTKQKIDYAAAYTGLGDGYAGYTQATLDYVVSEVNRAVQLYNKAMSDAERTAATDVARKAAEILGYITEEKTELPDIVTIIDSILASIKGSAAGSLVSRDALYRAGEHGLQEAIVPLERPDVLMKVGTAIANNIPEESLIRISQAIGKQNAGIVMDQPTQQASEEVATRTAQRLLEKILPAMVKESKEPDEEALRPLMVGTLVADDRGLRELKKRLDVIDTASTRRKSR